MIWMVHGKPIILFKKEKAEAKTLKTAYLHVFVAIVYAGIAKVTIFES